MATHVFAVLPNSVSDDEFHEWRPATCVPDFPQFDSVTESPIS